MEDLYLELNSLLPQTSRELPLPDQLDEAANYIKELQVSVEKNRERKRKLVTTAALEKLNSTGSSSMSSSVDVSVPKRLPRIEIQETGPIFHISLVTSLEHKFMFHEIIRVLTEELGAGLTHAGYSIVDDAVFHIFDCKVEDCDFGATNDETPFTYERNPEKGPEGWGKINPHWKTCNTGKFQSPIDLTNARVSIIRDEAWRRQYKPAPAVIVNRGHDVMVSWKGDAGKITIRRTEYKLVQCHWHSPSEHTVNGTRYDMELHMVHTSAGGKTAVIGVLYKLGKPNEFLTRLLDGIKTVGKEERDLGIVDPRTIRFQTKKFYRYIGSLTVPPCTEGVIWTVVKRVNTISMEQIAALRSAVDDGYETNSRPVQERNGRSVWFYDPNV
ncbi:unnamed protein product [Brassica rapa]|uniref:Carbonic anhydrase n=2 Tax=Brassica campestris TaxID=3711 RepID=A0A8D9HER1_BRACM|nr:unnamed protein product [Brassica rapa]